MSVISNKWSYSVVDENLQEKDSDTKQDTRIQKFEADGSQRDGAATLQGRGSGIHVNLWDSFVGKEEMYVRDGLHLSGKGAAVFAEGHK